MEKKQSYLSEREYQHSKDGKYDNIRQNYWEQMFGGDVMSYLLESNENFRCYLNQDEYCEEENRESGLLAFLSNEKNESRDRVGWSGKGNGKKLYFAEFYNRILDYGIGILKKILADIPYRMKSARPAGMRITGCHQSMDEGMAFGAGLPEHDFVIHLAFQLQDICLRTLISEMHSYKQSWKR